MSRTNSNSKNLGIVLNTLIVVFGVIGAYIHYKELGLEMFKYYTVNSNIFVTIASLLCLLGQVFRGKVSSSVYFLKYMATCCVIITLIVVITVLDPINAKDTGSYLDALNNLTIKDSSIFYHVLVPLLSLFSLGFCDRPNIKSKNAAAITTIPTLIYGVILLYLNYTNKVDGPYVFLKVNYQPVWASILWILGLLTFAYLLAVIIKKTCCK